MVQASKECRGDACCSLHVLQLLIPVKISFQATESLACILYCCLFFSSFAIKDVHFNWWALRWLCAPFLMFLKRFASTSTGTLPLTIRQILASGKDTATKVHVHGWVKSVRRQKNITFAVVNDGSCASGLQTVLSNSLNANFHGYVCPP